MAQITPFELWTDFKSWVNTQQGGFMPPQSIFIKVANVASLQLWNKWTKMSEKSQEIKDYLLPFLVSKNIIVTQSNSFYGTFTPPDNYGRFATAKILLTKEDKTVPDIQIDKGKCCKGNKQNVIIPEYKEMSKEDYYDNTREAAIEMVDNQKWSAMLEHLTKFPTFEKPKITQINGGFKVAPREVSVVVLNYYTEPVDAIFGYTSVPGNVQTGSGGAIQYNPATSRNFQWSKIVKPYLLQEIQEVYTQFTRDQQLKNTSKKEIA